MVQPVVQGLGQSVDEQGRGRDLRGLGGQQQRAADRRQHRLRWFPQPVLQLPSDATAVEQTPCISPAGFKGSRPAPRGTDQGGQFIGGACEDRDRHRVAAFGQFIDRPRQGCNVCARLGELRVP